MLKQSCPPLLERSLRRPERGRRAADGDAAYRTCVNCVKDDSFHYCSYYDSVTRTFQSNVGLAQLVILTASKTDYPPCP